MNKREKDPVYLRKSDGSRANVYGSKDDLETIKKYCKITGRSFSGFLVLSALEKLRRGE